MEDSDVGVVYLSLPEKLALAVDDEEEKDKFFTQVFSCGVINGEQCNPGNLVKSS